MAAQRSLRTTDSRGAIRLISAVIVAACLLVSLAPPTSAQDDDPLRVVASFSVLADIIQIIGGDHVEVTSLVPVGGDAHTFDPSPDQIATLTDADLVVEVGNDFEPWLNELVEASGTSATRFVAFPEGHDHATPTDDHDHEEGDDEHDHAGLHAWLDVHNTIHAVEHLAETLTEIDPDDAADYQANADAYIEQLASLDQYIVDQTATLPDDQRLLITTHSSFDAFANAYGYTIAGVLLESHSTEGADASASHVADLVEIIRDNDIPAIFPDSPADAEMLEPVASEADVEIAPQLYVDTLGEEGSGTETYIEMMRHNIDTIVTALGG